MYSGNHVLLSRTIGSDHPYAKYLRRVRSLFTEKWFDVGSELLEPGDERQLKIIKSNNKLSLDESCAEMLDLWIEKQPDASWDQLIEALSAPGIEMYSVASKIKSMLIKGNAFSFKCIIYVWCHYSCILIVVLFSIRLDGRPDIMVLVNY